MGENYSSTALYAAALPVAYARAWRVAWIVMIGWILFPFALATVFHPSDVIRLHAKLDGLPKPDVFTAQQLMSGFVQAVFALAVLIGVQLVGTTLFYRRVQMDNLGRIAAPTLWPVAGFLTAVIGNLAWVAAGQSDFVGWIIGCSPIALTVICERVVEGLGRDFVFGRATGAHPGQPQSW